LKINWEIPKLVVVIGDRCLLLFALNEECPVSAGQQPALTASLPFVHTARRCYRWRWDRGLRRLVAGLLGWPRSSQHPVNEEFGQYPIAGGSKSRNKVAVGEPAAGSLTLPAILVFRHGCADLAMKEEWRMLPKRANPYYHGQKGSDPHAFLKTANPCTGLKEERSRRTQAWAARGLSSGRDGP